MKYYLLTTIALALPAFSQLPKYTITLSQSDYQLLFTRDIFSDSLIPASFEYQGEYWNDAQIRFKGHSTRYYPKKSFRVKFPKTHLFQNMQSINFNAMYTDKSFLREKITWDIFNELNQLSPRAHHANFSINGKEGLYLFIEKVDKYFLQNRGRIIAPLYEANDTYISADLTIQPDSLLKIYYDKEIGNAADYSDLAQLINAINLAPDNSFYDTLYKYFDVKSILNWFTVNILTMMGDSYNKNYLLYRDTSKLNQQWVIIPWDYDLSFGRSGDPAIPYPGSLLNDGFAYTFPPLSGPSNVLKDRFIATPSLLEELRAYVDSILVTIFTEEHLYPLIDSLSSLIENDVLLDEQKWGTTEDFYDHIDALKYYITARRNYLKKTFVYPPSGEYNVVTRPIIQSDSSYHFITYDGRQIATLWFKNFIGLDSIQVRVYPDSTPPWMPNISDEKYVKRWVEIIPYPSTAQFTAKLQWMYSDISLLNREVGSGVQDERLLRCYAYNGSDWVCLSSKVNYFGNFVTVDSITENECGDGKYFALMMSETYTQKWYRQQLNYWQKWYDIRFIDSLNGFVVGEHGTVLKTTDGGGSWTEMEVGLALPLRSIGIASVNNIFIGGDNGFLYQSTNLGDSWVKKDLGTTNNILGIRFRTYKDGWIYGEGGLLKHTTDAGQNWISLNIDSTKNIAGVALPATSQLIVYLEDGTYLHTSNEGMIWNAGELPKRRKIHNVVEKDFQHWIVGDSGLVLFYKADNEWVEINIPSFITIHDLYAINETTLFAGGDNGKIFYTTNSGLNWYEQYTADSHDLLSVEFINDSTGFAVGSGGTILITHSTGTITSVSTPTATIPQQIKLYQNYPNPFNPITTITYDLNKKSRISLRVYNLLGQIVATLVDDVQDAGQKKIVWNGSNCSNGVYFYTISVKPDNEPPYFNVQKMMLLK